MSEELSLGIASQLFEYDAPISFQKKVLNQIAQRSNSSFYDRVDQNIWLFHSFEAPINQPNKIIFDSGISAPSSMFLDNGLEFDFIALPHCRNPYYFNDIVVVSIDFIISKIKEFEYDKLNEEILNDLNAGIYNNIPVSIISEPISKSATINILSPKVLLFTFQELLDQKDDLKLKLENNNSHFKKWLKCPCFVAEEFVPSPVDYIQEPEANENEYECVFELLDQLEDHFSFTEMIIETGFHMTASYNEIKEFYEERGCKTYRLNEINFLKN